MPMPGAPHRTATHLIASIASAFILVRLVLYLRPDGGGLGIFGMHVHHLLTGIVLIALGGIPAVLFERGTKTHGISVWIFGFGLGLALDEWVLSLIREGAPGTAYSSPVSLVGGMALVFASCAYALVIRSLVADQSGRKEWNKARRKE